MLSMNHVYLLLLFSFITFSFFNNEFDIFVGLFALLWVELVFMVETKHRKKNKEKHE